MTRMNLPPGTFEFNSVVNMGPKVPQPDSAEATSDATLEKLMSTYGMKFDWKEYPYARILDGFFLPTLFSMLYFSRTNINEVQGRLKTAVYQSSNFSIGPQDEIELVNVMKDIYVNYGRPPLLLKDYRNSLNDLNTLVVEKLTPNVISNIKQYLQYLKDSSTQPVTMQQPINTSVTGTFTYRSTTDVLVGDQYIFG